MHILRATPIVIATTLTAARGLEPSGGDEPCELFDDFTDGQVFDGQPIPWQSARGRITPGPEGLECVATEEWLVGILATQEVFSGDITVRVRASFNNTPRPSDSNGLRPEIAAAAHWNYFAPGGPQGYNGSVIIGGRLRIEKWTGGQLEILDEGCLEVDPAGGCLDLDGDWLEIELSIRPVTDNLGTRTLLELRVWRADDGVENTRPTEARLSAVDWNPHSSGIAGAKFFTSFTSSGPRRPVLIRSVSITWPPCGVPAVIFLRGDGNDDGVVDISDPIFNIEYQFLGNGQPGCLAALDTNADAALDISDPVYSLEHQFLGKPAPPPPYPECGPESISPAPDVKLEPLPCEEAPVNCPRRPAG